MNPGSGVQRSTSSRRQGRYTMQFPHAPTVAAISSFGGPMEGDGPLGKGLDHVYFDPTLGEKHWDMSECRMLIETARHCCHKAGIEPDQIDLFLAGDLLSQVTSSNFAARELDIPFLGIFAACATFTGSLGIASMALEGGFADLVLVGVSSHHESAERQYRFPIELGGQRPLTAQWTGTGATAVLLAGREAQMNGKLQRNEESGPRIAISHATFGRVIDMGIKDPFYMGSAMAPAAVDTIIRHLEDTGRDVSDYDAIVTGDLGKFGHAIAGELLEEAGYKVDDRFMDCGNLLYDPERQDVHAGASGTVCSAMVFRTYLYPRLQSREWRRILLVATGSLFSKDSSLQGESIPGVGHAVAFEIQEENL